VKNLMKYSKLKCRIIIIGVSFLLSLSGCGTKQTETFTNVDFAMGTVINQTIYSDEDVTDEVIDILVNIEDNMLSWRINSSEIANINAMAGQGLVSVSQEVKDDLQTAVKVGYDSDGALDITIGKLSRLWNIEGENPSVPEDSEIQELLKDVDYKKLQITQEGIVISENTSIDLGAVGKGIGCDNINEYFDSRKDVQGAVVSVGGSILVYGTKPDQSNWKVGITDPRGEVGDVFAALTLNNECYISTSGDYEKYFIQDEKRYHHILNPKTGYPSDSGLISVTIVSDSGIVSDCLSTACFVLGYEKSLSLLEKYNAQAVFVDTDKKVLVTEGLKNSLIILNDDYIQ
jgi:thiamine biosynthesis lipoprotein